MGVKEMEAVWEDEALNPTDRLVLLCLASHADKSGVCFPSLRRLQERTGLSERGIQTSLKRLREAGRVKIDRAGGPNGCNLFTILTPAGDAPPQEMHPAGDAPPQEMHPAGDAGTPRRRCGNPPQEMHPNSKEPLINLHNSQVAPPAFSDFWERWPLRKVGKKESRGVFGRLSAENKQIAIDRVEAWATAWRKQYPNANEIHPVRYLRNERWNDEFGEANTSTEEVDRFKAIAERNRRIA